MYTRTHVHTYAYKCMQCQFNSLRFLVCPVLCFPPTYWHVSVIKWLCARKGFGVISQRLKVFSTDTKPICAYVHTLIQKALFSVLRLIFLFLSIDVYIGVCI